MTGLPFQIGAREGSEFGSMRIVRGKRPSVGEREDLIEAVKAKVRRLSALPNCHTRRTKSGIRAGARARGTARTAPGPRESVYHHAGYLSGHLFQWLSERGRVLEDPLRMIAAGYAASLADAGGQKMLGRPDRPVTAHSYAAIRVEQTTGQPLSEIDERILFEWLLKQTDTECTETLRAKVQRLRQRRHERLQLDEPT